MPSLCSCRDQRKSRGGEKLSYEFFPSLPRDSRWRIFPLSCFLAFARERTRREKKIRLLNIIIEARNYESVHGGAEKS